MAALLSTAESSSNMNTVQSFACNNRVWKVQKNCSRSAAGNDVAVCVDCADPCSSNSLSGLAPCATAGTYQTIDPSSTMLSVTFQDIDQPPVMQQIKVQADAYMVSANVSLSKPGTVYCGLYGNGQTPPSSTEEILLQTSRGLASSVYNVQSKENVSSISITAGISPLTLYTLYCFAVSPASGTRTSLATMLQQAVQDTTTTCCRKVHVRLASWSIPEGLDQTSGFLSIEVEGGRPRSALHIHTVLQRVELSSAGEVASVLETFPSSFVPSSYSLASSSSFSSSSSSLVFSSGLSRLTAGSYRLTLNITGSSAPDYSIAYYTAPSSSSSSALFSVLASTAPLPAPSMLSATFASDGSFVQIAFSGETNRGGMPSRFDCSRLFRFACAEISTCVWRDASNVLAYVSTQSGCAVPRQVLSLAPSAAIKARCVLASCTAQTQLSWPNISAIAVSSFLTIAAPSVFLSPTVVMSMPASIGSCSPVQIDVTASTGDGGRAWNSSQVTVSSMDVTGNVRDSVALQAFVQSASYRLFPQPTAIPASYLEGGLIYTFQVTLCNFLGACAIAVKQLVVMSTLLPTVALLGPSARQLKRSSILSIAAQGSIPVCANSNSSAMRYSLTYSWSVSRGSANVPELNLVSSSKDPSRFLLAAYSLQVGAIYLITASASLIYPSMPALLSASTSASTQVLVVSGDLIASIDGGNIRSVRIGQSLILNASRSFDEDIKFAFTSTHPALYFTWSCRQILPELMEDCSDIFDSALYQQSAFLPMLQLKAIPTSNSSSSTSEARVTVQVFDSAVGNSRSAQAAVSVVVLPSLAPVIQLSAASSDLNTATNLKIKYNAEQPLQLIGKVDVPAQLSGWVSWHVDSVSSGIQSLSSVVLSASVAADVSNMTVSASSVPRTYTFHLPLNTALLPTGINLLFSLSCSLRDPGSSSTSSVAVQINSLPRPGLFAISPDEEVELSFLFAFTCSRWIDEDLPLSYQFGFVSNAGSEVTLRSKLPASFAELGLPAGMSGRNYSVSCFAQVYDVYEGKTTASYAVKVREAAMTTSDMSDYVLKSVQDSTTSNNVDSLKQTAATSSSLLNRVNCSQAPVNCGSLNRLECYRTPHTCGPCLSYTDYVGDDGDSNEMCMPAASFRHAMAQSLTTLQHSQKGCAANCSGHGRCSYRSVLTQEDVNDCAVGDVSCVSYCLCEEIYASSSTCAWSEEEVLARQQLREELTSNLEKLIELEDVDSQSVQSLMSSLSMISQNIDEISHAASGRLLSLAGYIMEHAAGVGLTNAAAGELLSSIQSILSAAEQRENVEWRRKRMRRLGSSFGALHSDRNAFVAMSEEYNSTLQRSQEVLSQYVSFLSGNLAPGQTPVQTIQPSFRLHVSKIALGNGAEDAGTAAAGDANEDGVGPCGVNTTIGLPSRASEAGIGLQTGAVIIPLCPNTSTSSTSLSISLISTTGSLFGQAVDAGSSLLQAHPLTLSLSAFPCTDPLTCFVDFELSKQQYRNTSLVRAVAEEDRQAVAYHESYNVTCRQGDYSRHDYVCANDGKTYNISCQGQAEIRQGNCPLTKHETRCAALVGYSSVDYGCRLVKVSADNITCSCPLINLQPYLQQQGDQGTDGGRRLSASTAASGNITIPSGSISINYVSMLQAITSSFVT
ncbi:hypothetical protein EON64_05855, partial [archaeon]